MKTKLFVALLALSLVLAGVWVLCSQKAGAEPLNSSQSDKYDGDCTGTETTGRCADKCPNQTDILQGYSKDTGAAVCKPEVIEQQPVSPPNPDLIPADVPGFEGK